MKIHNPTGLVNATQISRFELLTHTSLQECSSHTLELRNLFRYHSRIHRKLHPHEGQLLRALLQVLKDNVFRLSRHDLLILAFSLPLYTKGRLLLFRLCRARTSVRAPPCLPSSLRTATDKLNPTSLTHTPLKLVFQYEMTIEQQRNKVLIGSVPQLIARIEPDLRCSLLLSHSLMHPMLDKEVVRLRYHLLPTHLRRAKRQSVFDQTTSLDQSRL